MSYLHMAHAYYHTFLSGSPLNKFIYEILLFHEDFKLGVKNNVYSRKDKYFIFLYFNLDEFGDYAHTDVNLSDNLGFLLSYDLDKFNLPYSYDEHYSNIKIDERKSLIDKLLESIPKIKFKIKKILLYLNMFANGFINYLKLNNDDITYLSDNNNKRIIVLLYNFYIRLALFLGLDLFYINPDKSINTLNSAIDKNRFLIDIKNLISQTNIDRIANNIIQNLDTRDVNSQINKLTTNNLYLNIPGNISPSSGLQIYLNRNMHERHEIRHPLTDNDEFINVYVEYYSKLYNLDRKNNLVIKQYTGNLYKEIGDYINSKIYQNNKSSDNTSLENYINSINLISKKLENHNVYLFQYSYSDYIFVYRFDYNLTFGECNNYLTMPINTIFTSPIPMSTGINEPTNLASKNIILRIKLKKYDSFIVILEYSDAPYEKEILIPQGTQFKLIQRQYLKVHLNSVYQYIYVIDLEVVGNIYNNFKDFSITYRNQYLYNEFYFKITHNKALLCDFENYGIHNYISRLYNAIYSNTIPMLFNNDIQIDGKQIRKIIKGYLFRRHIPGQSIGWSDKTANNHPLNIEIKLLQLTTKMLHLESPPTPHLIELYGMSQNCNANTFVRYVKNKICKHSDTTWICKLRPIPSSLESYIDINTEYFKYMDFASIEYAEKGTLLDILDEIHTPEKLYHIYFQIFYTLGVLYDYYGFVHFDLKPGNILFIKDHNYKEGVAKYYEYIFNNNIYHIPVYEYMVKIADYDASFYNGIDNIFISKDSFHSNKVENIPFSKIDIYQIFNLLNENTSELQKIKGIQDGIEDNYIYKLYELLSHNSSYINFNEIPQINKLLMTNRDVDESNGAEESKDNDSTPASPIILGLPIFNFPKVSKDLIIKSFIHNSDEIYKKLIVSPQIHYDYVDQLNGLRQNNDFRLNSIKKISILRNNPRVLRIMSYNIHEWRHANMKLNQQGMINEILLVFPDILCVQENKEELISISGPHPNKTINLFHSYYEKVSNCNADNGLSNTIYVKKTIKGRVKESTSKNIGKNATNSDARERCYTSIEYTNSDDETILIANVHLHYNNLNNDMLININNMLDDLKVIPNDKIIIGDFNSYSEDDYRPTDVLASFKRAKEEYFRDRVYGTDYESYKHNLFAVCNRLENTDSEPNLQLIDMYKSYLDGPDNFFKDYKTYIPLNTNSFGGRIDHAFWNKNNKMKLLGMYKLYSDESDHAPIIIDLYENNTLNKIIEGKTFNEYIEYTKYLNTKVDNSIAPNISRYR